MAHPQQPMAARGSTFVRTRARIACSNRQRKRREVAAATCVRLRPPPQHNGIMLYRIGAAATALVLHGGSQGDNTRVCAHGRAARARAQRDRTDGRYSIAVCRICSLCRDHVLVLIRALDKIALCYRGSCLRDPGGREREREEQRERERKAPSVLLPTACPPPRSSSLRPSRAYSSLSCERRTVSPGTGENNGRR